MAKNLEYFEDYAITGRIVLGMARHNEAATWVFDQTKFYLYEST